MAALPGKQSNKSVVIASFIFSIVLGSLAPDVDHYLALPFGPSFGSSYGHIVLVPVAILGSLAFAYFGRLVRFRLLNRNRARTQKK